METNCPLHGPRPTILGGASYWGETFVRPDCRLVKGEPVCDRCAEAFVPHALDGLDQ